MLHRPMCVAGAFSPALKGSLVFRCAGWARAMQSIFDLRRIRETGFLGGGGGEKECP